MCNIQVHMDCRFGHNLNISPHCSIFQPLTCKVYFVQIFRCMQAHTLRARVRAHTHMYLFKLQTD